jgi:hypothetical protein
MRFLIDDQVSKIDNTSLGIVVKLEEFAGVDGEVD